MGRDSPVSVGAQAAAAAKKPIIVITLTAVPLDIAFFKDNAKVHDRVGALLQQRSLIHRQPVLG